MNKKNTLSILTASVMILSVMFVSTTTVIAEELVTPSGYVYVDDVITEPDYVKLIIAGHEVSADLYSDGYYIISSSEDVGETGVFHVKITSGSKWWIYQAAETITIEQDVIIYEIDLHIDTSDEPIDSGGGSSSGGGSPSGGGPTTTGDDDDTTGDDEVIPNLAPEMVSFTGNETGTQNTNYTYSVLATDNESHDVRYTFDWGDESNDTTDYYTHNTTQTIEHMWTSAGIYEISAYAMDNYPEEGNGSVSNSLYLTVLIDVHLIDDPTNGVDGYLTDDDSDGIYDMFYDCENAVEYDEVNGTYLIDTDCDGEFDYIYNPDTGTGEPIVAEEPDDGQQPLDTGDEEDYTMYYIAAIVIIVVLLLLFFLAGRKKKK